MASLLSQQERRILAAAKNAGIVTAEQEIDFDWRAAARSAGIPPDEAAGVLKGLRRFGFVASIGSYQARLTESGVRAAERIT